MDKIMNKYKTLFEGLGRAKLEPIHIEIDRTVKPIQQKQQKRRYCKPSSGFNAFFLKFRFTPCMAEQPLRGVELQEKKHKKDYRIHKICLERTYS